MAAVAMPLHPPGGLRDEQVMDTRTPSPSHRAATPVSDYQPDLSGEVAMLSTKLINAINYQTTLDDSLQQTRHQLEASQRQYEELRKEKKRLDDMIVNEVLIRKSAADEAIEQIKFELMEERAAREAAEKAKKQTEGELENLTSALFEEANEMVAAARKDTEAVEKRNSQLRSQLSDTEVLLSSQQEQLQDLKLTMEKMSERGDTDTVGARDSVPSTPIHAGAIFDTLLTSPNAANTMDFPPEHPLHFSQLLVPVLRSDVTAFHDFQELLQAARKASSHVRSSSGASNSGLASASQPNLLSNTSPNLPGAFSFSTNSSPYSTGTFSMPVLPLKDARFYKRSLMEDIEPTLRLDLAPGLSFLSRRSVLSAFLSGSLVVEPFTASTKFFGPIYACSLCGENRKAEPYVRKHRFRTSEEDSAQRYPLCDYCLGRIRATGDFITFLRMVRDGYWRADTEEEQRTAWEESVRLRERMFWARLGGGVVPASPYRNIDASNAASKSGRPSLESVPDGESKPDAPAPLEQERKAEVKQTPERPTLDQKLVEVFRKHRRSMSFGRALQAVPNEADTSSVPPLPEATPDETSVLEIKEIPEPKPENSLPEDVTAAARSDTNAHLAQESREPRLASYLESREQSAPRPTTPAAKPLQRSDVPTIRTPEPNPFVQQRRQSPERPTRMSPERPTKMSPERPTRMSPERPTRMSPERSQSGVLARVRAMEAKAQTDPGADKK